MPYSLLAEAVQKMLSKFLSVNWMGTVYDSVNALHPLEVVAALSVGVVLILAGQAQLAPRLVPGHAPQDGITVDLTQP